MSSLFVIGNIVSTIGCASSAPKDPTLQRTVIDSATQLKGAPQWVSSTKSSWNSNGGVELKGTYSVRGNERINACYEMAKIEAKKALITEFSEDLKGILDTGTQGMSEDMEMAFSQAMSSSFEGTVQGLRVKEQYYERYLVSTNERLDCFVLAEIVQGDYNNMKRKIMYKMAEVNPKIKEALINKQLQFFKPKEEDKKSTPMSEDNSKI
jgi:hypothetical protein